MPLLINSSFRRKPDSTKTLTELTNKYFLPVVGKEPMIYFLKNKD